MKTRNGFVSNSSSSSFVCNVCGSECSGMDMGLSEAEMYCCENEHYFCDEHCADISKFSKDEKSLILSMSDEISNSEKTKLVTMSEEEIDNLVEDCVSRSDCSFLLCPICTFKEADDKDVLRYLLKKTGFTRKQVLEEMETKYVTYDKLNMDLKNV